MTGARGLRVLRALGWATFAAAPVLLVALAVVSSRPNAPASLVTYAAIAAWIAGALAFGGSLLHARGARTAARTAGAMAALVVAAACGVLAWSALQLGARSASLDHRERSELVLRQVRGEARYVHPHLGFSLPPLDDGMERAPEIVHESERAGGESWARAHRVWAWEGHGTQIVVDLSRAPAVDDEALRRARDEIASELARAGEVRTLATGSGSSELEATLGRGGYALSRIVLFRHGHRAYRLVITVTTRDPIRWKHWLDEVATSRAASSSD